MITSKFKNTITSIPNYLDGAAYIYSIDYGEEIYPIEKIKPLLIGDKHAYVPFEEISISDRVRYEFESRSKKITMKIRIAQLKEIGSKNVLKIGDEYHRIFNAFHFTNKEGFKQSDITLEEYPNAIIDEGENKNE